MTPRRLDLRPPEQKRPRRPRDVTAEGRVGPARPNVVLDWAAHFKDFCQAHRVRGGGWVLDGDVLLFGDGWSCALDHRGPYFPPPRDPKSLHSLLVAYWRKRAGIVRAEAKRAADTLEGLNELRKNYPLPLTARTVSYAAGDDGYPRATIDRHPVDWKALSERLRWLYNDALDCEAELLTLGERP